MPKAKKITKATFKSFIRKNIDNLYLNVQSSFSGMTDMVETLDNGLKKVEITERHIKNTCGINGIWLVGSSRDYFNSYQTDTHVGIEYFNSCGGGVIAIAK